MRLLFFDMEFADGRVPGSIYSFGYLVTDEEFRVIEAPTDLLIDPDSTWNAYVEEKILAYPKETVEASPRFPEVYERLSALFASVDVAVGFAVGNDTRALACDCRRYGLEPISFRTFDMEKVCRLTEDHPDARGLAGCVRAWCGEEPENQHRSDGDALATMQLLRGICRVKHVDPEMMLIAYPECIAESTAGTPTPKKSGRHRGGRRHRGRGGAKKNADDPSKKTKKEKTIDI